VRLLLLPNEPSCLTRRIRYLAVFPLKTRQTFLSSFSGWEVSLFLDGLAACHITPEGPTSPTNLTLLDAPPALIYLALWNPDVLCDNRILSIFAKYVPPSASPLLPPDPPPPGLFFLLFHESPSVSRWAKMQSMRCQHVPISVDKFVGPYLTAFEAVEYALTMAEPTAKSGSRLAFPFSQDTTSIWSGSVSAFRLLPREYLKSGKWTPVDLCHIVAGHLHDTGPRTYPFRVLMNMSPDVFNRVRGCTSMLYLPPSAITRRSLVK
jgi:senataxin